MDRTTWFGWMHSRWHFWVLLMVGLIFTSVRYLIILNESPLDVIYIDFIYLPIIAMLFSYVPLFIFYTIAYFFRKLNRFTSEKPKK